MIPKTAHRYSHGNPSHISDKHHELHMAESLGIGREPVHVQVALEHLKPQRFQRRRDGSESARRIPAKLGKEERRVFQAYERAFLGPR